VSLDKSTIRSILAVVESHALASGQFVRVNKHEVANPPTLGISAEIWVQRIMAIPASGLASSSGLLVLNIRPRMPATFNSDAVEEELLAAVDALMSAYSGDFELGGSLNVRSVDLLGSNGVRLAAAAGYLNQETLYRVYTIDLPIVVNDLWTQSA